MSDYEGFVLDSLDLNDGTSYELEAVDFPPPPKRPVWLSNPDADGDALLADPHYERRIVPARIRVQRQSTMDLAIAKIAAVEDKLQLASRTVGGIPLIWTPANSTKSFTIYVLSAEFDGGVPIVTDGEDVGYLLRWPVMKLKLDCAPFGYGPEVIVNGTTNTQPVQFMEVANVTGDVDAEATVVLTDGAAQSRMHAEIGVETSGYNSASPSDLILEKSDLTATGFAGSSQTRAGSFGANVWRGTLINAPVTICGTDPADADSRNHVGVFNVKARVFVAGTGPASVRLSWRAGSDAPFESNEWAVPIIGQWSEISLGQISIEAVRSGQLQTWEGRIEAMSDTLGDTCDVDFMLPIPAEQYGRARGLVVSSGAGAALAYDGFAQAAGALGTTAAPLGGNWGAGAAGATTAEDGDADDFTLSGTPNFRLSRNPASADTSLTNGRYDVLSGSSTIAAVAAQVDVDFSTPNHALPITKSVRGGVLARFVDTDNWLMAVREAVNNFAPLGGTWLRLIKRVAGTVTTLGSVYLANIQDGSYTIKLVADAAGNVSVYTARAGNDLGPALITVLADANLATGGALDDGRIGIYDASDAASVGARLYDNYLATVTTASIFPACYSGRSLEARWDSAERQNAAGTAWGDIPAYSGAKFFLPCAGATARKSRIVGKMRRADVNDRRDALNPDANIADSTGLSVRYRPRYLVIPR